MKWILPILLLCGCSWFTPATHKVIYDTIKVPKDSITEASGVIISSYGSNKIIKGNLSQSQFIIKYDSMIVIIEGDTIRIKANEGIN